MFSELAIFLLKRFTFAHLLFRAGPEYSIIRIFVRWVGIRFSILRFEYPFLFFFFFSRTPGIPRETVLNLSAWLNICNRLFANERRPCWPIACIYFMKNLLLWARLPHIYIWNNELKRANDATCERTLCYHKTECDACVFFLSTVPRCEWKSWISVQQLVVLQTRCADVKPLWESEREKTRYSWITHAVFKWLI